MLYDAYRSPLPLLRLLLMLFGFTASDLPLAGAEFGICLESFFGLGFCSELYTEGFSLTSFCGIWNTDVHVHCRATHQNMSVSYNSRMTNYILQDHSWKVIIAKLVKQYLLLWNLKISSQKPTIRTYPDPTQSSPHLHTILLQDTF